jgi:hypothetical protein
VFYLPEVQQSVQQLEAVRVLVAADQVAVEAVVAAMAQVKVDLLHVALQVDARKDISVNQQKKPCIRRMQNNLVIFRYLNLNEISWVSAIAP